MQCQPPGADWERPTKEHMGYGNTLLMQLSSAYGTDAYKIVTFLLGAANISDFQIYHRSTYSICISRYKKNKFMYDVAIIKW